MKKVLLIDDEIPPPGCASEDDYMLYYSDALRASGYDVVEAHGPREALNAIQSASSSFAAIIMDVMMPPDDVFDADETRHGLRTGVLLAARIAEQFPKIPVLVLTNVNATNTIAELNGIESVRAVLFKMNCTPKRVVEQLDELLREESP